MIQKTIIDAIEKQDWLDTAADTLQPAMGDGVSFFWGTGINLRGFSIYYRTIAYCHICGHKIKKQL